MPYPTEDLKEWIDKLGAQLTAFVEKYHADQSALRQELHEFRTEVAQELHEFRMEVANLTARTAAFESKVLTILTIGKWAATVLGGVLLISAINGVFWAGNLSAEMRYLNREIQDIRENWKAVPREGPRPLARP